MSRMIAVGFLLVAYSSMAAPQPIVEEELAIPSGQVQLRSFVLGQSANVSLSIDGRKHTDKGFTVYLIRGDVSEWEKVKAHKHFDHIVGFQGLKTKAMTHSEPLPEGRYTLAVANTENLMNTMVVAIHLTIDPIGGPPKAAASSPSASPTVPLQPRGAVQSPLCNASETTAFGCTVKGSGKMVALCLTTRPVGASLTYRFGKVGTIELEYPDTTTTAATAFEFEEGSGNHGNESADLSFSRKGFLYTLSQGSQGGGPDGQGNFIEARPFAEVSVKPPKEKALRLECEKTVGDISALAALFPKK
ncbi:MAG: hypothetical protein JST92_17880 [Deltaproteobacteria bacterium]|nr:hypothetical protein [Deltaproteobacteria bacterium]